jgi:hypothetical protein
MLESQVTIGEHPGLNLNRGVCRDGVAGRRLILHVINRYRVRFARRLRSGD